jgi:hypothetical protein
MSNLQSVVDKLSNKQDYDSQRWGDVASQLLNQGPSSRRIASHFPEFTPPDLRAKYLGHFRGSMLDETNSGPFLLEELQSDPAQTFNRLGASKEVPGNMQDWVGQMGRAALHHAAQAGADAFHVPTSQAIERLRGDKDYGWLYDKSLPQDVLGPVAKHFGVEPTSGSIDSNTGQSLSTQSIPMTPEMRDEILNKGVPYAVGGPVRMGSFRTAGAAPTASDPVIAHLMRHAPGQPHPMRFAEGGHVGSQAYWDQRAEHDMGKHLKAWLDSQQDGTDGSATT